MRLIDADKFNEFISNHMDFLMPNNTEKVTQEEIHKFIHNQPTAYDIDKVMEELEKLQKEMFSYAFKRNDDFYNGQASGLDKAIEIVKNGLKEQKNE